MNELALQFARRTRLRLKRQGRRLRDERGATMLEWVLLLAVIGLPSYVIIRIALSALIGNYQMMTTLNALPFP